ncbi:hypothetical protein E5S70_17685 [Ensifer adhaerens]|uniref:hypothetical protein n=1 Tax=Ensifer canadensis TaxID=555315 RepID=UPI0014907B7C|nr:hypothetical protein [Ensifer canadensis]NOV17884.1 hypothetical protein [Ensifer canadensis]
MASIASLLVPGVDIPRPDHSWIGGIADSIGGAIQRGKQNQSFTKLADLIATQQGQAPAQQPTGGLLASLTGQQAPQAAQPAGAAPVTPVRRGQAQGSTYRPFIETVRAGGLTNPNALAAVAAYGDAESGWSPENAARTWSDPSQSGQPGTSGGILSWRGDRYSRLAAGGDLSPEAQARYFLQEDPQLIAALNQAKSPEEAASLMANAWKFAGYDKPGGEAGRRSALARNYFANEYANQPAGNSAAAAIEAQAPGGMGSPLTEQAFDDRFGASPLPADQIVGEDALAARLAESNAAGPVAQPAMAAPQVEQQPAAFAPNQVADASGGFAGVPGIQPIQRGGVDPSIIQFMLRDPNLREMGVKLWAQNVTGKTGEPWQFVQGADGTLLRANQVTGAIEPVGNFAKRGNPTALMQNLEAAGFKPGTKEYRDAVLAGTKGGITVNTGDTSGSGAFYKKADEKRAENMVDTAGAGAEAQRRLVQIGQLEGLLQNVETGGLAAAKQLAGEWGINTEGLSDIQAVTALINQMVPAQRPPGSGTMSDADLALFKQSLPRLINQPGGNELIVRTMRDIAAYDQQIGDIANDILDRVITPAEGRQKMREVLNPLEGYRQGQQGGGKGGRGGKIARPTTDAEFEALPSGAIYIDPDDGKQYRKP